MDEEEEEAGLGLSAEEATGLLDGLSGRGGEDDVMARENSFTAGKGKGTSSGGRSGARD